MMFACIRVRYVSVSVLCACVVEHIENTFTTMHRAKERLVQAEVEAEMELGVETKHHRFDAPTASAFAAHQRLQQQRVYSLKGLSGTGRRGKGRAAVGVSGCVSNVIDVTDELDDFENAKEKDTDTREPAGASDEGVDLTVDALIARLDDCAALDATAAVLHNCSDVDRLLLRCVACILM